MTMLYNIVYVATKLLLWALLSPIITLRIVACIAEAVFMLFVLFLSGLVEGYKMIDYDNWLFFAEKTFMDCFKTNYTTI